MPSPRSARLYHRWLATLLSFAGALLLSTCARPPEHMVKEDLQDGDIVLIRSYSYNATAIAAVTRSPFTHCGLIFKEDGRWRVYEGAGRKGHLDLDDWLTYESGSHVPYWKVFRLKDRAILEQPGQVERLKAAAAKLHDTPYDHAFIWDYPPGPEAENVYCSELIWKAYDQALDLELCTLRSLDTYPLNDEALRILNSDFCRVSRGGGDYSPSETVVAPSDIAESRIVKAVSASAAP